MKSTSTLGPDSAIEGRRQNRGEIAKNIGEGSVHCSARFARRDIFAVWFLPSPPPLSAEPGPRLPLPLPRLPLGSLTDLVNHLLAKLN